MVTMLGKLMFSRTPSPEIQRIRELKKEAGLGSVQALRWLWKIGYVVVTINGKQINLREKFGDTEKSKSGLGGKP